MQETRVSSLIREDPTCCGATQPVHHNYWACALEPRKCSYWAHLLQLSKPRCPRALLHGERSHRSEKCWQCNQRVALTCSNKDPAQPKLSERMDEKSFLKSWKIEAILAQSKYDHFNVSVFPLICWPTCIHTFIVIIISCITTCDLLSPWTLPDSSRVFQAIILMVHNTLLSGFVITELLHYRWAF